MKNKLTRAEKKIIRQRRRMPRYNHFKDIGVSVAIGQPETQGQAGYEALEFKPIGELVSLTQPF